MPRVNIFLADNHNYALDLGWGLVSRERLGTASQSSNYFMIPDVGNISRDLMLKLEDGRRLLNPLLVKELDNSWSAAPNRKPPKILNRWTQQSPLRGTDHHIFVLWGFAEMHVFAFEEEWRGFGINADPAGPAEGDLFLLPRALVKDTLAGLLQSVFDVVDYLRTKGLNVSTLAGPPPVPDNNYILEKNPGFKPSDPYTRLYIYRVMIELFQTRARAAGYLFHKVPPTVVDEEGFRRQPFWGDGVYGNDAYGREVMLSLESALSSEAAKPADTPSLRQNLGHGRPATQSSVSPWSREKTPEKEAARVVSGRFTGSYNCHTAFEDRPWWRVDLERQCKIQQIRIYNRVADPLIMARSNRFQIDLSDDDVNWRNVFIRSDDTLFAGGEETPFIWVPHLPMRARFVRIQLPGRQFLHLEQVEVYGEEAAD